VRFVYKFFRASSPILGCRCMVKNKRKTRTKKRSKSSSNKTKPIIKQPKNIPSMHLISILDVSDVLELNKTSNMGHNLHTMEHIEEIIKGLRQESKLNFSRVKVDTYGKIMKAYYYFDNGVAEITLSDVALLEFFFEDKRKANQFKKSLKKYLKKHIDNDHPLKNVFIDSINVFRRDSSIVSSTKETKLINKLVEKSLSLFLISIAIFIVIELGKAVFTELFVEMLKMHQVLVIVIIAITVAFLFRPIEKSVDFFLTKWIFRK